MTHQPPKSLIVLLTLVVVHTACDPKATPEINDRMVWLPYVPHTLLDHDGIHLLIHVTPVACGLCNGKRLDHDGVCVGVLKGLGVC
jgi:hypothetical protein